MRRDMGDALTGVGGDQLRLGDAQFVGKVAFAQLGVFNARCANLLCGWWCGLAHDVPLGCSV